MDDRYVIATNAGKFLMSESNIIYVLTNPAMPDYVKVGRTGNLRDRLRQLWTTGIPLPFQVHYAARVGNGDFVEKQLHDAFHDNRKSPKREFFVIAPERIVAALKLAEIEDLTPREQADGVPEAQQAVEEAQKRRAKFAFSILGINPGTQLRFSRDESIVCTVVDDTNVELEGEVLSLTGAAGKAFELMGEPRSYSVQGPDFWSLDGDTLHELRLEKEDAS